jgi:methylmalonyl-CoA mutase
MNLAYIPQTNVEGANMLALEALNGGTDGVIFKVNGQIEYQKLFKGILFPACYLGLNVPFDAVHDLFQHLSDSQSELKGFISVNNLVGVLDGDAGQLMTGFGDQIKTLVIKEPTTQYGTLEEITRLLCQGILVINSLLESGIPLPDILKNFQFSLNISSRFLWEICRLRCLRILFHQVMVKYGSNLSPACIPIHVFTSHPISAENNPTDLNRDRSLQLISNTTQAMSAILGGCNTLSVITGQQSGDMIQTTSRVARNVSHILREESFFHRSADPIAGSYYLEDLTHNMMKHIWSGLREMERTGGYRGITTQR